MSAPRVLLGKTLAQWARETGIPAEAIRARLDSYGWAADEAVGLVPHVSLRGKCKGKAVTPRYKKEVDGSSKNDDTRNMGANLWNVWPPRSGGEQPCSFGPSLAVM